MKGIILAGGLGSRLYPISRMINKHMVPVYDKPMLYYPLSTLLLAGIRDILVISANEYLPKFQELLGDGQQWGVNFSYAAQHKPGGIAEAFIIAEDFIGNSNVCLILGDNIFQGSGLDDKLVQAKNHHQGATLFSYYVENPKAYGVIRFNGDKKPIAIEEKPENPGSNLAVTGLYFYDSQVVSIAKSLKPSARNELEISDINSVYLNNNQLRIESLGRGFTWLDMGTHQSLLKASIFIEVIESRQGLKVGCPEEIAWRRGYINSDQLAALAHTMPNNSYRQYLTKLIEA